MILSVTKCKMLENSQNYLLNRSDYTNHAEDIITNLFKAEKLNIKLKYQCDQLEIREPMVKLMRQFCRANQFNLSTFHLGVFVLDVYMDQYIISKNPEYQKFVALVCLMLAAKSEDIDGKIPSIKSLLGIINLKRDLRLDLRSGEPKNLNPKLLLGVYQRFAGLYSKLEFGIFATLEFNVIRPTCVTFINFLQPIIVTELDYMKSNSSYGSFANMKLEARDYAYQLLEFVILDVNFFNVTPSKVAAAIIATIRTWLKIPHVWNEEMELNTRYTFIEIRRLVAYLLENIGKKPAVMPEESPRMEDDESGFVSASELTDPEDLEEDLKKQKQKSSQAPIVQVMKKRRLEK